MEVSPPSSKGKETPTPVKPSLVFYESDSEGENNLMVNGAIAPFTAQVEIMVPHSETRGDFNTMIDSGCTRYLVSLQTVEKLGLE